MAVLDINVRDGSQPDIKILAFSGDWDLLEKERANWHFSSALTTSDLLKGLIVDLTEIQLLDSSGVEVLITSFLKARELGARMVIVVDHNNYVIRKFRNLGMFDQVGFEFFETIDEAEASFA